MRTLFVCVLASVAMAELYVWGAGITETAQLQGAVSTATYAKLSEVVDRVSGAGEDAPVTVFACTDRVPMALAEEVLEGVAYVDVPLADGVRTGSLQVEGRFETFVVNCANSDAREKISNTISEKKENGVETVFVLANVIHSNAQVVRDDAEDPMATIWTGPVIMSLMSVIAAVCVIYWISVLTCKLQTGFDAPMPKQKFM